MDRIRRTPRRENWTNLPNAALEDERLSWEALGLLAYLLSRPDGQEVSTEHLSRASADGEDVTRSTLRELAEAGYYDPESGTVHAKPRSA